MDRELSREIVSYIGSWRPSRGAVAANRRSGDIEVLVVEDDEEDFHLLRELLNEVQGSRYHIHWRRDYASAIEALKNSSFDACLVDFRLGAHTGLELIEGAKASGIEVPMILLTGHGDRALDFAAMQAGAIDFVDKAGLHENVLERSIRYSIKHYQDLVKLRAREQNFATIFDLALEGIVVHDGNLITDANQSALATFGVTQKSRIVGRRFLDFIDPENSALFFEAWKRGDFLDAELVGRREDGARIWIQCASKPIVLEGKSMRICAIRDVTKAKDAEENRRLSEALRVEKEAAQAANEAKSNFLAHMSHEIRTPLGAVMGFVDLASSEKVKESDRKRWLGIAKNSSLHLLALINQLLDLAKVEAKQLEIDRSEFDLEELLTEIREILETQARKKGLGFEIRLEGSVPRYVPTDRLRLKQVLLNLLGNSVKFTQSGRVVLTVDRTETKNADLTGLRFLIEDTGVGIAKKAQHRLF